MKGYLLVRAAGGSYGFRVADVEQVLDLTEVYPAPGCVRAVRGVTVVADRLVPLVHLVALLTHGVPPKERGSAGVVARCPERSVAFEVDDVDHVVLDDPLPLPEGWRLPWASGVARGNRLIPIVDVTVLAERLAPPSGSQPA